MLSLKVYEQKPNEIKKEDVLNGDKCGPEGKWLLKHTTRLRKKDEPRTERKKKTQQTNPETFIGFGYIKYQQILKPSSAI